MAEPRFVYLHGFASGPEGKKAKELAARLQARGLTLERPDLNEGPGGFEGLTVSRAVDAVMRLLAGAADGQVVLVGSSFGGYVASLVAQRSAAVSRLVLLAPAFDLPARWTLWLGDDGMAAWRASGFREVQHFATGRIERLGFGFYRDALGHPPFPLVRVPCLVLHGRRDEVVPIALSHKLRDGAPAVRLVELDDGHELHESGEAIWRELAAFTGLAP